MLVGDPIAPELLGGRSHAVLVARGDGVSWVACTRTRRGARRRYRDALDWLPIEPGRALAAPGEEVRLVRVERRVVAEQRRIRTFGEPGPDCGVREPRRPHPAAGGEAAVADLPDERAA